MDILRPLWPYRFVTLSPEQIQNRRELLDKRGYYAQLSGFLLFICIAFYTRFAPRTGKPNKTYNNRHDAQSKKFSTSSWLDSPPGRGWGETRKQYLVMLAWLGWLIVLAAWKTGDDYLHLTKSLGHTALATIPFQVLISPKLSRKNPILRLSGLSSQAVLTPYHRLSGRLVIFPLLTLHGALYLAFFALTTHPVPLLPKRLQDLDVQLGIVGITLVFVLWATSSSWSKVGGLRRRLSRRVFYVVHVLLVSTFLAVAYYHVEFARRFVIQGLIIYAVDVVNYEIEKVWT